MNTDRLPVAPPFDADVDAFDPERAGFQSSKNLNLWIHPDTKHIRHVSINTWRSERIIVTMEGGFGPIGDHLTCFALPANLQHNVVLAILRANGWEG